MDRLDSDLCRDGRLWSICCAAFVPSLNCTAVPLLFHLFVSLSLCLFAACGQGCASCPSSVGVCGACFDVAHGVVSGADCVCETGFSDTDGSATSLVCAVVSCPALSSPAFGSVVTSTGNNFYNSDAV